MLSDVDPEELEGGEPSGSAYDEPRDWSTTNFKVHRRVFRKSLKLYFYLLLKFAGPAFGIVLYLTALFFWDTSVMKSIQFAKNQVYYAQQLRATTHLLDYHVRDILTAPLTVPEDAVELHVNATLALNHYMLDVDNGLMFGNYFWSLPGTVSTSQSQLMLKNGCYGSVATASCTTFADGLMANGLHGALLEFERRARNAVTVKLEYYVNETDAETHMNATGAANVIKFMDDLTSMYLSDGLTLSAGLLESDADDKLSVYIAWLIALSVSSITGMFLFYTMGYRPAILQMDKDMRRTRAMLLMFPDEVIDGVERIRNMLREITVQMQ